MTLSAVVIFRATLSCGRYAGTAIMASTELQEILAERGVYDDLSLGTALCPGNGKRLRRTGVTLPISAHGTWTRRT